MTTFACPKTGFMTCVVMCRVRRRYPGIFEVCVGCREAGASKEHRPEACATKAGGR